MTARLLQWSCVAAFWVLAGCGDDDSASKSSNKPHRSHGKPDASHASDAAAPDKDAASDAAATDAGGGAKGDVVRVPDEDPDDAWLAYGNGAWSWYQNRGNTTLTADNVKDLKQKWMIDSEVTAPPVVVGDRLWVATGADGLYALNVKDGKVIWHDKDASSFSGPAYDPDTDTLYLNRWEGGVLHAFDASSGDVRWTQPISDQEAVRGWSSPVLAGGWLFVGVSSSDRGKVFRGGLAGFELATERRTWTYKHAKEDAAGVSVWGGASVDLEDGVVFAGSGNNYSLMDDHSDALFAVDMHSGEMLWNTQLEENDLWAYDCISCGPDHDFGVHPILIEYGGRKLVAAGQKSGSFWMLDRATGEILWEQKLTKASHPAYGGVLNNGAFDGKHIIVAGNEGASPGTLYALDPDPEGKGRIVWKRALEGLVLAPITIANGLAFVPVGKTLEIVDCATGKTLKTLEADASVAGAAAVSQGYVFFGTGLSYYDNGAEPGAFYAYGL
jgi:polyvinyl alcohol dehydrogenase (cytochrome)